MTNNYRKENTKKSNYSLLTTTLNNESMTASSNNSKNQTVKFAAVFIGTVVTSLAILMMKEALSDSNMKGGEKIERKEKRNDREILKSSKTEDIMKEIFVNILDDEKCLSLSADLIIRSVYEKALAYKTPIDDDLMGMTPVSVEDMTKSLLKLCLFKQYNRWIRILYKIPEVEVVRTGIRKRRLGKPLAVFDVPLIPTKTNIV